MLKNTPCQSLKALIKRDQENAQTPVLEIVSAICGKTVKRGNKTRRHVLAALLRLLVTGILQCSPANIWTGYGMKTLDTGLFNSLAGISIPILCIIFVLVLASDNSHETGS